MILPSLSLLVSEKIDISPSLNIVLSTYFDLSNFNTHFNIGITIFITADFFGPPWSGIVGVAPSAVRLRTHRLRATPS